MSPDGQFLITAGQNTLNAALSAVKVYQWNGTDWDLRWLRDGVMGTQIPAFCSISADGNVIAYSVAADLTGLDSVAIVARWNGTDYALQGDVLMTPDNGFGIDLQLSDSGDRVVIGAYSNSNAGANAGTTRIYQWSGSEWVQIGMDLDGEAANDFSGLEVALSAEAEFVVVAAAGNDGGGSNAGHVRVYELNPMCPLL